MQKRTALVSVLLALSLSLAACNADAKKEAAKPTGPTTEEQKTLYSLGFLMSQNIDAFSLTADELAMVQKGLADGVNHATPPTDLDPQKYTQKLQDLVRARMEVAAKKSAADGVAYLETAAKAPGATKLASGVIIKHTKEGTGPQPKATDQVKVHYEGKLINGKKFDSSFDRGEPATFPLNGVIPCWTEGVQAMKVGGEAELTCPADLAYGPNGHPPAIPPQSTLVFKVQLLDIVKAEEPAKTK